jgi:hypothetical protein
LWIETLLEKGSLSSPGTGSKTFNNVHGEKCKYSQKTEIKPNSEERNSKFRRSDAYIINIAQY